MLSTEKISWQSELVWQTAAQILIGLTRTDPSLLLQLVMLVRELILIHHNVSELPCICALTKATFLTGHHACMTYLARLSNVLHGYCRRNMRMWSMTVQRHWNTMVVTSKHCSDVQKQLKWQITWCSAWKVTLTEMTDFISFLMFLCWNHTLHGLVFIKKICIYIYHKNSNIIRTIVTNNRWPGCI